MRTRQHTARLLGLSKPLVLSLALIVGFMTLYASPAVAASVVNGDFETGTLAGFTVVNQQGGSGSWFSYSGTTAPASGRPITAPPQGTFAATTDQNAPGSHVMYQDIVLEPNAKHELSFTLYYRNEAGAFATPNTLDYNVRPNQQYRVDILKPSADPFSVDPADVLASVYRTEVGDPNTLEPTRITSDLSPYAGQTVRLRFAAVETQFFFRASVDDIQVRSLNPGTLQFDPASYTEDEAAGTATITVIRTGGSAGEVTVDYATSNGTATAGQDYASTTGTLTFADGETSKTFTVPITDDTSDEPDETVDLMLSNPMGGATLGAQNTATLTITDDDAAPSLSINDRTVTEGDTGTTDATFTVTLSQASGRTVTVDYATTDGTANAPGDYASATGTLTFEPGQTSKEIPVPVNGDTTDEADETFSVDLSNPTNATTSDGTGQGTITDDDATPPPPPAADKPACSDGRDNDGDGKQDLNDPGCSSRSDGSEIDGRPKCTIKDTDGDNILTGTNGRDVICAGNGDDVVNALGGGDVVYGGAGDDAINGGRGDDELYGESGNDALTGGSGRDRLSGGPGKDETDQ